MFFFSSDPPPPEIYPLSPRDALRLAPPGSGRSSPARRARERGNCPQAASHRHTPPVGKEEDRKSTRLNSSHANISYAVFCLKKKNTYLHSLPHLVCRFILASTTGICE